METEQTKGQELVGHEEARAHERGSGLASHATMAVTGDMGTLCSDSEAPLLVHPFAFSS